MKIEQVYSQEQIGRRVAELGHEIRAAAGDEEVFLLGILNGGSVFLADLLRVVEGNVSYGFIDVVRDVSDTSTANALEIDFVNYTNIADRNVFVIKDVVTSGVIESYLLMQLRMHRPKTLRLLALLDRPEMRTVDLATDMYAFQPAGDGAFVGYGLELDGRHGNLPYIGRSR